MAHLNEKDFIEARESRLFMNLFRIYTRILFKRRFRGIYMTNRYTPAPDRSTLYYMNHSSWWDALVPFLLNEYHFRQNARALMDIEQLSKYRFFRKIGVFSVNRANARSAMYSLIKTREWLGNGNSSIYLFPQGSIRNEFEKLQFENGIGWLGRECTITDLVPLAIHINNVRGDKPDLFIETGKPVQIDRSSDKRVIAETCRKNLEQILEDLHSRAYNETEHFSDFFSL